ncbi:integrase domain-containing protein [Phenylobacterium sp.]|uniref:integrase domain-containing protein n=1 Tax=Phenylobacterium sp. TaxID=1871053 RepID=UPI002732F72C|nr:integrase domain-containing protein [Phenylobacterium sp.]MDP3660089.1 integrase domain-containing protein [Phenylobacterium sp.]
MSRNFGLGSRDMSTAGRFVLNAAARAGTLSFSTAGTNAGRWSQFVGWAKDHDVKKMENVTSELVREYGRELASRVKAGEMADSTAQNLVSSVNSVMGLATKWKSVSPTKECGIEQRSMVREDAPGAMDRGTYERALQAVKEELGPKGGAIVELAREFGLRSKEASLFDARTACQEAKERGYITVSEGTKGGREREIEIRTPEQAGALVRAAEAQGDDRAVMPAAENWQSWREGELRDVRELVAEHTGGGLHDLRAAYACERYTGMTGHAAPCAGGQIADKGADREAREVLAKELGHGRIDVVSEYVGGRK